MIAYEKNDLIMFVDSVGHVALATYVEKIDDDHIRVKNPLWVSLVPRQDKTGSVRVSIETPSWSFRDFMADHNEDQLWDIQVRNYSFYEGKAFSDILKLHYYNSFSRINDGVKEEVDANGKPVIRSNSENDGQTPELKPAL